MCAQEGFSTLSVAFMHTLASTHLRLTVGVVSWTHACKGLAPYTPSPNTAHDRHEWTRRLARGRVWERVAVHECACGAVWAYVDARGCMRGYAWASMGVCGQVRSVYRGRVMGAWCIATHAGDSHGRAKTLVRYFSCALCLRKQAKRRARSLRRLGLTLHRQSAKTADRRVSVKLKSSILWQQIQPPTTQVLT